MPFTEKQATGHRKGLAEPYKITVKVWDASTQELAETSLEEQVELYGTIACAKAISAHMITLAKNAEAIGGGMSKFDKSVAAQDYLSQEEPDVWERYRTAHKGNALRDMLVAYYDSHLAG